ncbi:NAD-dependent epimerase/dehydratase family protein [Leptolyngbya sp. FACHB-261]|nr:NAD-dependent epimerase/dehydratase family protein [Leptolyngbya sp. FACHB-261]MBD2101729.1 NAD-dependent epimerase/dehydratase family protein [Leptolyngbya sp. FACHB-261]
MRVLVIGGTRFVGVYLTQELLKLGHEVTLFNRGKKPSPEGVRVILGDRTDPDVLKSKLAAEQFDAVFDNNGRELSDTQPLAELFAGRVQHFVYMSSAGVYKASDLMPHLEGDPVDPKSRHKGKHDTEAYLKAEGLPFTSIRPTYIYGPQNYNDLEAWFFDRILRDRPVPIPGNGQYLTQLGHVQDLAVAMARVLGRQEALGQIYNISDVRAVTFNGMARLCAEAAGKSPESLKLVHYDASQFNFGKRKAFPFREQHFFTSVDKALAQLDWCPAFTLLDGLKDFLENDYLKSDRHKAEIDFSTDDEILAR